MHLLSVCWDITSSCNLTCEYCYRIKNVAMLKEEYWEPILLKLRKNGVKKIAIGGGEPLLVKNFDKLLKLCHSNNFYTSIISNGTFFSKEVFDSIKPFLNEIVFSIDGGDAQTHSIMRGAEYTEFNNILNVIDYISSESSVNIRVNSVVTKINYANLALLGDKIKDKRISYWRLMQFYPMNDANEMEVSEKYNISLKEWNSFRLNLIEKYENEIILVFADNSNMSANYFTISPDGNVFTSNYGEVAWLGSILDKEISELIDNPKFNIEKHYELYNNWV